MGIAGVAVAAASVVVLKPGSLGVWTSVLFMRRKAEDKDEAEF